MYVSTSEGNVSSIRNNFYGVVRVESIGESRGVFHRLTFCSREPRASFNRTPQSMVINISSFILPNDAGNI